MNRAITSFLIVLSTIAAAQADPAKTPLKDSAVPNGGLNQTMKWILEHIGPDDVKWAISVDGRHWITFQGKGQPATLTFLAGNPAAPDSPVGGLRYFWDGPGHEERNACVRLVLRFTGIAKTTLRDLDERFVPLIFSSIGDTLNVIRAPSSSSFMVELESAGNRYAPSINKQDASCSANELRAIQLPDEKRSLARVGLITRDGALAVRLYEAIRLGISQSTTAQK